MYKKLKVKNISGFFVWSLFMHFKKLTLPYWFYQDFLQCVFLQQEDYDSYKSFNLDFLWIIWNHLKSLII